MNNKKKLLIGSLSTAAVVAGVAMTGGTSAYYFDAESALNNSFEACDFDLVRQNTNIIQTGFAEGGTQTQAQGVAESSGAGNIGINLSNLQPGDAFDVVIDLKNVGTCEGELWADIDFPITDNENSNLEPEQAAGDNTTGNLSDPSEAESLNGGGELDTVMQAKYSDSLGNSTPWMSYHQLAYRYPDMLSGAFGDQATDTITVQLKVPDDGTPGDGNEIMSDSFTFAVHFVQAQKNKIQDNTDLVPTP